MLNDEYVCASSCVWVFYLQIVRYAVTVALQIEIVKEEGDEVVLWCLQDDGTVYTMGVDVRPARALQVTVFLFIGSATAWKPQQSEHLSRTKSLSTNYAYYFTTYCAFVVFLSSG